MAFSGTVFDQTGELLSRTPTIGYNGPVWLLRPAFVADQHRHNMNSTPEMNSDSEMLRIAEEVLGYLNFSSGVPDAKFQNGMNRLFAAAVSGAASSGSDNGPTAPDFRAWLITQLETVAAQNPAFKNDQQVRRVLELVFEHVVPEYHAYHSDLLFHIDESQYVQPLFLARVCEAVLQQDGPWTETERIVSDAISQLNDYVGFRPVAVLENDRQTEPYPHERFRPVPLYIRGAGVAVGPYQELIQRTIDFLRQTPGEILREAWFDVERMDELSLDLRSHDHSHPVNKRTNYMFGEWDPYQIDNKGYYRRFVVRQIILDALLNWIKTNTELPYEEVMHDAAAVLCGTMLMASSISGAGPETYDSTVSLTLLLPHVARQRDAFYARLLEDADGERALRLIEAAQKTQQPFGHVRHQLNMYLSGYGARQVQHRHIAWLYARMGFEEPSRAQADIIPTLSVRFECEIQCRITTAHRELASGSVTVAAGYLREIEDLIQRGIQCGALVDPWNILGFQGQFPLFSAREDAVPDNRVETLLEIMERTFGVFSAAMAEAAAAGESALLEELAARFRKLADQWDRYATTTVEDLPEVEGQQSYESAEHVSRALSDWRQAGEAAGDISFWRQHVDDFKSAKSYALVVKALLQKDDTVASLGLMMQWLSEADETGLESGPYSVYPLLVEWIESVTRRDENAELLQDPWPSIRRMFDYLEANAGEYWSVPDFEGFRTSADLPQNPHDPHSMEDPEFEEESDEENLFRNAYEDVTFRDSADDGQFGETADGSFAPGNTEFEIIGRYFEPHLKFLNTIAHLWQITAASIATIDIDSASTETVADRDVVVKNWLKYLQNLQDQLRVLMDDIWDYEISTQAGDLVSNVEYDMQLQSKFLLLHNVIATSVNCLHAQRLLHCCLSQPPKRRRQTTEELVVAVCRGVFRRDTEDVKRRLPDLLQQLLRQPLLYVPLENGGHPMLICKARTLQSLMRFLVIQLPGMGLLQEALQVLQAAYTMERSSRPGGLAVTEFDRLFRSALRHSLQYIIRMSKHWRSGKFEDEELVDFIREVVDHYVQLWTMHSSTMRLSRVEELKDEELADDVQEFIELYGSDLFHARMLTLGNIRAVLHHGIDLFLEQLEEESDPLQPIRLLDDIDEGRIESSDAIEYLELIYESIVDKFDRFLEYNTTTTQSDYGEKFFCLLDFLRIEVGYEREFWNLTPFRIAHETLTSLSKVDAAILWEDELRQSTSEMAANHLSQLNTIEQKYGVRLPSIRDRLDEKFVKPLAVNRMIALVPHAMEAAKANQLPSAAFSSLQEEVDAYLASTLGSGIDIPQWLYNIEREINRIDVPVHANVPVEEPDVVLPPFKIDLRQMRRQLRLLGEPLRKPQTKSQKHGDKKPE